MTLPDSGVPGHERTRSARGFDPLGRVLLAALAASAIVTIAAGIYLFHAGWRLDTVGTPSMSPALLVGALVVTEPLGAPATVGDVIVFHPPGDTHTYVHRVVAVGPGPSYRTKGDNDPEPDPWSIPAAAVVGREVLTIPDLGWLLDAGLIFAAALALAAVVGSLFPRWRRWALFDALCVATWLMSLRVHPFVQWQVVTVTHTASHATAWLFNTGILPLRVQTQPGSSVVISPGHSATITGPLGRHIALVGTANLSPWQWVAVAAICALPMVVAAILLAADGKGLGNGPCTQAVVLNSAATK